MLKTNNENYGNTDKVSYLSEIFIYCNLRRMSLGDRVKEARLEANLSQDELARIVGISQPAIKKIESGETKHTRFALDLARALHVQPDWLTTGQEPKRSPEQAEWLYQQSKDSRIRRAVEDLTRVPKKRPRFLPGIPHRETRLIPVINYVQAGNPKEVIDDFAPGAGMDYIATDLELGPYAFALVIDGNSMVPDFMPGDKIIVDPQKTPNPGQFVVARCPKENATFKKYRPRGHDEQGHEVFELVPLNEDYPTLRSDASYPCQIIGTMVEHRRYNR